MRFGLEAYRRLLGAIGFEVLCLLTRRDPHANRHRNVVTPTVEAIAP